MLIFFWFQQSLIGHGLDVPAIRRITRDLPGFLRMEQRPSHNIHSLYPTIRQEITATSIFPVSVNVDDPNTLVDSATELVGSPTSAVRPFSIGILPSTVAIKRIII